MIMMVVLVIGVIGLVCVLAYRLATYALPFMLGLTAARFAYHTGSGLIGAGVFGLLAGAISFGVLLVLLITLRSSLLRVIVVLIFVVPAAMAGYQLVYGIAHDSVPSEIWRQIFCIAGGICVGTSALARLMTSVSGISH